MIDNTSRKKNVREKVCKTENLRKQRWINLHIDRHCTNSKLWPPNVCPKQKNKQPPGPRGSLITMSSHDIYILYQWSWHLPKFVPPCAKSIDELWPLKVAKIVILLHDIGLDRCTGWYKKKPCHRCFVKKSSCKFFIWHFTDKFTPPPNASINDDNQSGKPVEHSNPTEIRHRASLHGSDGNDHVNMNSSVTSPGEDGRGRPLSRSKSRPGSSFHRAHIDTAMEYELDKLKNDESETAEEKKAKMIRSMATTMNKKREIRWAYKKNLIYNWTNMGVQRTRTLQLRDNYAPR